MKSNRDLPPGYSMSQSYVQKGVFTVHLLNLSESDLVKASGTTLGEAFEKAVAVINARKLKPQVEFVT